MSDESERGRNHDSSWIIYNDGDVKLREYKDDKGFGLTVNGVWIMFTRAETPSDLGLTRFYMGDVHIGAVRRDDLPHGAVKALDEVTDDDR